MNISCRDLVPLIRVALDNGARVRFTATGGSMFPFLRHGEVVELEKVPATELRPGDIVLAQRDKERYVLHRILRVRAHQAYLAGDLGAEDGWIPLSQVLARARAVCRNGRWRRLDTPTARHSGLAWVRGRLVALPALRLALAVRSRVVPRRAVRAGHDEQPA